MSTIAPSRLNDVSNAALFRELTADNFTLLAEDIAKRVATYQNGSPTTVIGPPTSGARVLNEFWRDALGGEWRCTGAGTPGTWLQIRPAAVTADPSSGTIPPGYLILNVTTGHLKHHAGGYSWTTVTGPEGPPGATGPEGPAGPQGPEGPPGSGGREALTADRTYHVATTGSDSNDGLSAGAPFLTIQKALDAAAALDTVIYNVTVQVADGTYEQPLAGRILVGSGRITVQGNSGNPSAVVVRGTSGNPTVLVGPGMFLTLKYLRLEGNASGYALVTSELNGVIDIDSVVFGTLASSQPQIAVSRCGIVRAIGNYTIAAGGAAHVMAWGQGVFDCRNRTITVSGTPAFAWAFATASECSLMMFNTSTFSGSATGKRYDIVTNGVIQTAGDGVNLLPGNSAGTTATGGQYA